MTECALVKERLLRDLSRDPGILILAYPYARTWPAILETTVRQSWSHVGGDEGAAVYVHVPFCRRKCTFCDFLAYYGQTNEELDRYISLVLREIDQVASLGRRLVVESVAFGGGTPSLLSAAQADLIMEGIRTRFRLSPQAQVSLEVFPDHAITRNVMSDWRNAGVNRLSFGVQFLDDGLKKASNRTDTTADTLHILRNVREAGFDDFNVDLMCGLPEQTEVSWRRTYQGVLEFRPTHICVFPVSVRHEGIALYKRRATLPPPTRARQMYDEAHEALRAAGYERTTRHNFRLASCDCRYERMIANLAPLIGLGAHSISYSQDCIYKNHSDLSKYEQAVLQGDLAVHTGYIFPHDERPHNYAVRRIEYLFLEDDDFAARFGMSLRRAFSERIELLQKLGLVQMNGCDLTLTPDGIYYTAAVKRAFFHPSVWERVENMRPEQFKIERGTLGAAGTSLSR